MTVARGDVVLVDFPFAAGGASKVHPALIVQNDRDNRRTKNTIVAMITSRISRASNEPTQLLLDVSTAAGKQSGLLMNSVVNCANLFTLEQGKVLRKLGSLPAPLMHDVNACLKSTFDIP